MPGTLLHLGAKVQCIHAGQAQPMVSNPRVRVGGQQIVTQTSTYTIACTSNPPCATAQWRTSATRVKAGGVRVLLKDSEAVCVPTGSGLKIVTTQSRVKGT